MEWEKADYFMYKGVDGLEEEGNYELFLEHMKDRSLCWEKVGSKTIDESFRYLQYKIDKAITLIQGNPDTSKEQLTGKDQQDVKSLLIKKILG